MDVHKNAPLTPKGREAMVRSVIEGGLSKAEAGRQFKITPKIVAKWVERFRTEGVDGLQAKQCLPHAQWLRPCAVSATPASKSRLKSAFPRPLSAASCGGWD